MYPAKPIDHGHHCLTIVGNEVVCGFFEATKLVLSFVDDLVAFLYPIPDSSSRCSPERGQS